MTAATPGDMLQIALRQKCPRCGVGDLYRPGISATVRDVCDHCGLAIGKNDSADGPAVFLIFFLCSILLPLALLLDALVVMPLWAQAVLWTVVALGITIGLLRPTKAYVIALQYKHRSSDWEQ